MRFCVTQGEGRVQSRGQPIITFRPGEVVYTPGDEWHWHGATRAHRLGRPVRLELKDSNRRTRYMTCQEMRGPGEETGEYREADRYDGPRQPVEGLALCGRLTGAAATVRP